MPLVIGKCCAGSRFRCPQCGDFMVIPGGAVVTEGFGTSEGSVRAAADSHSRSGLVERPNIVDTTPRRHSARRGPFL